MSPPNLSLVLIMICFWVTFWLVQRYLIRPLGTTVAEREQRIVSAEKEYASKHEDYLSATARVESEVAEAARDAARIRGEYRRRAQEARQQALDGARQQADDRLREALDELDGDARTARDELRKSAARLARVFAVQLLGREVSP